MHFLKDGVQTVDKIGTGHRNILEPRKLTESRKWPKRLVLKFCLSVVSLKK